jgi:hypothetical protein
MGSCYRAWVVNWSVSPSEKGFNIFWLYIDIMDGADHLEQPATQGPKVCRDQTVLSSWST